MTRIRNKGVRYPELAPDRARRWRREYMRRYRARWWQRAVAKAQRGLEGNGQ